jgi:tetratricopeptide (TPR) repeat protein
MYEKLLHDPAHLSQLMQLLTESISAEVLGDVGDALALVDRAVALEPAFVPAALRRADLLLAQRRHAEAVDAYDACLHYFPALPEALQGRRHALSQALAHGARLLRQQPADLALHGCQAQWLMQLECFDDALKLLDGALALAPDQPLLLNLRGSALLALNRHEQALLCYDRILAQADADPLVLFNRGNVLQQMGQVSLALDCYRQALVLRPDFAEAELALAHALLLLGQERAGWQHHEARWRTSQLQGRALRPAIPPWLGAPPLSGRSILLWAEQGLGDTLQFVRYVPLVAAMARQVTLCVPVALQRLLGSWAALTMPNVCVSSNDKQLPPHDVHCPLMSLPLALRDSVHAIPAQVPYLHADAALVQQWSSRLASAQAAGTGRFRSGLAWAGRQFGVRNRTRDIALHDLRALADVGLEWISLQQPVPAADVDVLACWPGMRQFDGALTDMAETAALICNLDLVISADSAVIHLAGALGKPAWLLLRFESEWRWGCSGSTSHWYPGIRIFRQSQPGDWAGVAAEVAACLRLAARC